MSLDVDSGLFRCINEIWIREFRNRAPRCIWHYTGEDGLKGILESNSMWATSIKDLNDKEEFQYGQSLVDEILKRRGIDSPDLRSLICKVRRSLDLFRTQREVILSAFRLSVIPLTSGKNTANTQQVLSRHNWTFADIRTHSNSDGARLNMKDPSN